VDTRFICCGDNLEQLKKLGRGMNGQGGQEYGQVMNQLIPVSNIPVMNRLLKAIAGCGEERQEH
jgi:hypothetical protein